MCIVLPRPFPEGKRRGETDLLRKILAIFIFVLLPLIVQATVQGPEAEENTHKSSVSAYTERFRYVAPQQGTADESEQGVWMEQMRNRGVRLASFIVEFNWTRGGRQLSGWRVVSENYFRDYEQSEKITEENDIRSIDGSGLGKELSQIALSRAKAGEWVEPPHQQKGRGYCRVLLADNNSFPLMSRPWYGAFDPSATPLMRAALIGNVSRVKQLIEAGVDVNAMTPAGLTALIYAAGDDKPDMLRILLKAGASPRKNRNGSSALATAVLTDHPKNVALLLEAGADPNSRDADGETLLYAAESRNVEIVKLLKNAGAHN